MMKTVISNRSIGIRVLTPEMLGCTFKHVDSVLAAIERFRASASRQAVEHFDQKLRDRPHETLMLSRGFNNAISILGSRGSGKTSIIMTLEHILRNGKAYWSGETDEPEVGLNRKNIMMPILVPQDFVSGQLLLSWVITQLLTKAEEIEKEIIQAGGAALGRKGAFSAWLSEGGDCLYEDPLRECMDSLKASFELRYKSSMRTSDQSHVFQYMEEVRKDSNLAVDMLRLISMICDYYRYVSHSRNCSERNTNQEPLLFFAIDDLDLAPERSQEVLNLVLRYLQHPNVVVLCGWNQELFQSHLTMEVLRHQQMLDSKSIRVNGDYTDVFMNRLRKRVDLLDSARRLSVDNLKKAFPPALRYEVRGLKTCQRAAFPRLELTESVKGDGEDMSLIYLIEQTLLASRPKGDQRQTVEFMRNRQGESLLVYMRIFDNKARGLMNVYHAFQAMREKLENWRHDEPLDLTADLQSLVDIILFSNTHFVPYRRGIRDLIRIDSIVVPADNAPGKNVCSYFCDYQSIRPVLKEFREMETDTRTDVYSVESEYNYFPSVIIDTYVLLNFMQNVFHYVCGRKRYEHSGLDFSDVLNDVNSPVTIDGSRENLLSFALLSAGIREVKFFPTTAGFRTNLCLLDAYERNRFIDRQYDLSGAYSYRRLSNAVAGFVGEEGTTPIEGGLNAPPTINEAYLRDVRRECPEWMGRMEQIFNALRFTEENTSRLSRYRCLRRQNAYGDEAELSVVSRDEQRGDGFEGVDAICARHSGRPKVITDDDNDLLVQCIRRLNALERYASLAGKTIQNERDAEKKAINVVGRSPINGNRYFAMMMAFKKEFDKYAYGQSCWIPVSEYRTNLEEVFKLDGHDADVTNESSEDALNKARECLTANYDVLMRELKDRLLVSFAIQYELRKGVDHRFEYLLTASEALAKYREAWDIGKGGWTVVEDKAADEIVDILGSYNEMSGGYLYARELRELGPVMRRSGERTCRRRCSQLEGWLERNEDMFELQQLSRLYTDLDILRAAIDGNRRQMRADADIDNMLLEIGKTIAEMSALISFNEELTQDRSSSERNMVSWPIVEESRNAFDNWGEVASAFRGGEFGGQTLFDA